MQVLWVPVPSHAPAPCLADVAVVAGCFLLMPLISFCLFLLRKAWNSGGWRHVGSQAIWIPAPQNPWRHLQPIDPIAWQCSLSWAFDRWEEETPNRVRWDMGERNRLSDQLRMPC